MTTAYKAAMDQYKYKRERGKTMDNGKKRDPTEPFITLEDSQHAAFLKMLGYKIVPWIEGDTVGIDPNSKRVEFQVFGNPAAIEHDMQRFYVGENFSIQEFCRHLKDIKSAMYNLRRLKK
jgi:hypothetical protein